MIQLGLRTQRGLITDSVDKWELLAIAEAQLRSHRTAWKTHIDLDEDTKNLTVEFPIAVSGVRCLRYFQDGNC